MSNNNLAIINDDTMIVDDFNTSSFQFSGVSVDILEDNEYTLATLILDMSGSVTTYYDELIAMIKNVIETLRDPRAQFSENILFRLVSFNGRVYEEHGFIPLASINIDGYNSITTPRGLTSLYDACMNASEATKTYGINLTSQDYSVNAINIVVTDGGDNDSSHSASDVKSLTKDLIQNEAVESVRSVLVGVNTNSRYGNVKADLDLFFKEGGFDQYIDISDATPSAMAKLTGFVSKSVSLQAQANGTGTASKPIPLTF
jgi:hypothetical protein